MIPLEIIKNRFDVPSLPSFCTYLVTWRCNCHCKMCTIWKKPKEKELRLEEITNIFKQRKFDAVRITGGEPFLRNDLAEVINTIQHYSKPKMMHITSNGILTNKILSVVNNLEKTDNLHIKISIDAVGKKHDKIRGVTSAYQKAMKTVHELAKLKEKFNFYIAINQLILDESGFDDYWKLKKVCEKFNVPLQVAFAYTKVALYEEKKNLSLMPKDGNRFPGLFGFPNEKKVKLSKSFKEIVNSIPNFKERLIQKYYLKGLYNRLIYQQGNPNPPCVALKSHLRILPNGDIPVCLANSNIVGNLKKTSLKQLWFSDKLKKYRELVKKCPGCWYGCEIIPSAIYTGDIIKGLF